MRLFEGWRHFVLGSQRDRALVARSAFQAGARHVLTELTDHLDYTDAATATALRLNDEIQAFGRVALLPQEIDDSGA